MSPDALSVKFKYACLKCGHSIHLDIEIDTEVLCAKCFNPMLCLGETYEIKSEL